MNLCETSTPAGKRYQRRVLVTMSVYVVLLIAAILVVKHAHVHGWLLYAIALVPALPVLATIGVMGMYLQEEKDEYLRLITMRSMLMGTAVLLGLLMVSDFLRSISGVGAIPPFTSWIAFFVVFGVAQTVQTMRNRVRDDA